MWQSSTSAHGVHLGRSVAHPPDSTHGKYALGRVLEVDTAQVLRTCGARRPRDYRRRGEAAPAGDGAAQGRESTGGSGDSAPPDVRRMLFLDTETTGLGGPGTYAFLVGLGFVEDDAFVVRQHFIRSPDEEAAMLHAVAETLGECPTITTFNGVSFDVPLLRTRMRALGVKFSFRDILHCDLLYGARRLWQRRLPNCRLQTLEEGVLGFKRQGDVPSGDVPGLYFDFLETGDLDSLEGVFHHNVLDIISLAALMIAMHDEAAQA